MITLTCSTCGKIHRLKSIRDFSGCTCGATISPVISELIFDVENRILEIDAEINKLSSEGICNGFSVKYD